MHGEKLQLLLQRISQQQTGSALLALNYSTVENGSFRWQSYSETVDHLVKVKQRQ